jgi:hypothetical protein
MKLIIFLAAVLSFSLAANAQDAAEPDSFPMKYMPGDHELILMPTAYTMEQGEAYFSNYELFFLNFTYSATSTTHIGVFFLFPVTTAFLETLTLGVKQNYFRSEYFQGALWGTYTLKNSLYTVGNVFSIGSMNKANFHVGFGYAGEESGNIFLYLIGGKVQLSNRISGLVEYTNAKELLEQDFNGLISIGIRFRGESSAWELAGIRPLESTGEFLFFPLLKATFYF